MVVCAWNKEVQGQLEALILASHVGLLSDIQASQVLADIYTRFAKSAFDKLIFNDHGDSTLIKWP